MEKIIRKHLEELKADLLKSIEEYQFKRLEDKGLLFGNINGRGSSD